MSSEEPEYMTTAEVANLLRRKPGSVRMMRHRGTGPRGTRIGRDVLYDRAEVRRWLAAKTAADHIGSRAFA